MMMGFVAGAGVIALPGMKIYLLVNKSNAG
jgi:hypothetical protein